MGDCPSEHRYKMSRSGVLSGVCIAAISVLVLVGGAAGGVLESAAAAIECPQNLVVAGKLDDKKFMQQQINCILGPDSVCDEVGLKAKRIGPLVLTDHCPRPMCDECTKRAIRMVVAKMQHQYPNQWFHIQQKLIRARG